MNVYTALTAMARIAPSSIALGAMHMMAFLALADGVLYRVAGHICVCRAVFDI